MYSKSSTSYTAHFVLKLFSLSFILSVWRPRGLFTHHGQTSKNAESESSNRSSDYPPSPWPCFFINDPLMQLTDSFQLHCPWNTQHWGGCHLISLLCHAFKRGHKPRVANILPQDGHCIDGVDPANVFSLLGVHLWAFFQCHHHSV